MCGFILKEETSKPESRRSNRSQEKKMRVKTKEEEESQVILLFVDAVKKSGSSKDKNGSFDIFLSLHSAKGETRFEKH